MDNIIVNSALWYAEQSSQFLANSGANKLLDKGYDYYVSEFIPLGHRLIQNGQIEVRWIEPTFVLPEGKREVPVATVRRVLGA